MGVLSQILQAEQQYLIFSSYIHSFPGPDSEVANEDFHEVEVFTFIEEADDFLQRKQGQQMLLQLLYPFAQPKQHNKLKAQAA